MKIISSESESSLKRFLVQNKLDAPNTKLYERALGKICKYRSYIHISPFIDTLIDSGKVYASNGGGLGPSIYVVPVENGRIHNLGNVIIHYEMQLKSNKPLTKFLLFRNIQAQKKYVHLVDYLEFGELYIRAFNKLIVNKKYDNQHLKSLREFLDAENVTVYKSTKSNSLLLKNDSLILRPLFFETILEFLFLYQKNKTTTSLMRRAELSNWIPKRVVYESYPGLEEGFSLSKFSVDLKKIRSVILKNEEAYAAYIDNLHIMEEFVINRFKDKISRYYTYFTSPKKFEREEVLLGVSGEYSQNFIGQGIYRLFKKDTTFINAFKNEFYAFFRLHHTNIIAYENLPKGEIAIIPDEDNIFDIFIAELKEDRIQIIEKVNNIKIGSRPFDNTLVPVLREI